MLLLPDKMATFPAPAIVRTLEKLASRNLGPVMKKYLIELISRLKDNPHGVCNTFGLYFEMMNVLNIFKVREERDAVQHAIPSFVAEIVENAQNSRERLRAEKFVEEFYQFVKTLDKSIRPMQKVH